MNFFKPKNLLLLFATNDNQYLNFHYAILKEYFANTYQINFVGYFNQNGIKNTEKHILNFVLDKKIDIIISSPFANFHLSAEFYSKLKKNVKIIFMFWDDEFYFDVYSKYYSQISDAVITTDYFSVYSYRKLDVPAIWYFSPYSKNDYYPVEIKKDIDVSFLGDCTKNDRMEFINYLGKNGVNVETFGKGSKNDFVDRNKFSEIFSRSKINLHFTKMNRLNWINKEEPLLNRVKQNKGRPIEIALTKSFCLSEYAGVIEQLFTIGREIDIFYDKENLLEKIKYYLSNDKLRDKIAENAYKRALENYESGVYIPRLLEELEEILGKANRAKEKKAEIFLSRSFKVKTINALTFSMFALIKDKKILYALELFRELFKYGVFIFFAGFYGGLMRALKMKLTRICYWINKTL